MFYWLNKFGPLFGLLLVYAFFALVAPPTFRSADNLELMARQTAVVSTAAIGMTLVIITAGIDLSVGSMVALTAMIIAYLLKQEFHPLFAALAGVGSGALFGLVNGTIVIGHLGRVAAICLGIGAMIGLLRWPALGSSTLGWGCGIFAGLVIGSLVLWFNERFTKRIPVTPFIVTLAMMLVVRGFAKLLGNEQNIYAPLTWLKELLSELPAEWNWMLLPPGVWAAALLATLAGVLLYFTKLGRHIFAVGSNEKTARLCGVAVERVKLYVYTLCGATAGLAGLLQFSRMSLGSPTTAVGLELEVIAAVVIGGGSLSGGEGSILGSLVGALIMTVIQSGCTQMGLPNYTQEIITGAIIVCAVALDRLRHQRTE